MPILSAVLAVLMFFVVQLICAKFILAQVCKKAVKKLKAKKKYFVRIRTYKTKKVNGKSTKVYSSWSKSKTVKTK